jgi:DNA-directed RNA polymerase specialized sigma24 family protein
VTDRNRVECLLAMLLLKQMEKATDRERMQALALAGLTNSEIATLTGKNAATVKQQLYLARSKRARTPRRPAKRP